jgi:transcriptional regulator with PAS, ATPase and Fis domain
MEDAELRHIEQVMTRSGGDWRAAAALLGVSKCTLYRRLDALGLRRG